MVAVDRLPDLRLRGHHDVDLETGALLHLVPRHHVERIGHRDRDGLADSEEGDHVELPRHALGHETHDLGLEDVGREIHPRHAHDVLVVIEERFLGGELEAEEDFAERGAGPALFLERARESLGREMSLLDETLAERLAATLIHALPRSVFPGPLGPGRRPAYRPNGRVSQGSTGGIAAEAAATGARGVSAGWAPRAARARGR